jgi:lipoic acid synthetase
MKNRLPYWFKQDLPDDTTLTMLGLLSGFNINTVCQKAKCPNLNYCFKKSKLTFMILGDTCSRNCRFCAVDKSDNKNRGLDLDEPFRIAEAVKELGLDYAVITSVTRDDLEDAGASVFAKTIELIRSINRNIKVEVLIPDFQGKITSLKCVSDAVPDVMAHNLEAVSRLYKYLKPGCDYEVSLGILKKIKELNPAIITKSSLILGIGETENEVIAAMEDLRDADCDILTLGQYLSPSVNHYPVEEFIDLEQFQRYSKIGLDLGFKALLSGPLVRSSYRAEEVYKKCMSSS